MSFTDQIIDELSGKPLAHKQALVAYGYGLLLFSTAFSQSQMLLQTGHVKKAEAYCIAVEKIFGFSPVLEAKQTENRSSSGRMLCKVGQPSQRRRILSFYGYHKGSGALLINGRFTGDREQLAAFTAGAFLACGSVVRPEKGYHLEFSVSSRLLGEDFVFLLRQSGFDLRLTRHSGGCLLYSKDSETIEDLLTFIGATGCALELMEVKVFKDVRNRVNRQTNCDTANISKTITAAQRQIEAIRTIERIRGLQWLPRELYELARLRLENESLSLKEIGEMLERPISRSGVNHRLERIEQLAKEAGKEEQTDG